MMRTATTGSGAGAKAAAAPETIGLVGVGLLGSAIAERLLARGFHVRGFDLSPSRLEAFTALGGEAAGSAEEVIGGCRRIILSLPDSAAVGTVLQQGAAQWRDGQVVLDTTTGTPAAAANAGRELARRGVAYLDAAICGNSEELRRGDVLVVAGGPAAAFEACQDVFATFARRSWRIERKRADVGLWFHVKTTAPGVSRCVDDSVNVVLPGKTYTYRVAAFNAGGLSAYSGEVAVTTPAVTVPSAPTNLKATVVSPTQINLTWTDTSNNEDGFKLECKAGEAAEWKPVMGRTPANWTLFTDYGLEPGRTYAYRIRAFNAAGESAWSNEVTAQTAQRK